MSGTVPKWELITRLESDIKEKATYGLS